MACSDSHFPPDRSALFQALAVWLTEIPEIRADGSSPWLMMSQADPFLCPPRCLSNPPQFSYVSHDKSHHAFLLTLLSPLIHGGPAPPPQRFGQRGGGLWRVNGREEVGLREGGGRDEGCLSLSLLLSLPLFIPPSIFDHSVSLLPKTL